MRKPLITAALMAGTLTLTACGSEDNTPQTIDTMSESEWEESVSSAYLEINKENLPGTELSQIDAYAEGLCTARAKEVGLIDRVETLVEHGPGWDTSEAMVVDQVIGEEVCL